MARPKRNPYPKLKLLYLYKILFEDTDENHYLTISELQAKLSLYGFTAERRTLYSDIRALKYFGADILTKPGQISGYFLASRNFELPELKILVDAVSSSKFLTEQKSEKLLKKISALGSKYEASQLGYQIYVSDRVKSMNERIYLNIDKIQTAIDENKKITFRYFDYDINKKRKYRPDLKITSPFALAWHDENYYLIAYYESRNCISNFRMDRIEDVRITKYSAKPKPDNFNVADYLNSSFSMFSGISEEVELKFKNNLINPVIDKFGRNIPVVPIDSEYFCTTVTIKTQHPEPFFAWLFQFGSDAEIRKPNRLREEFKNRLAKTLEANRKAN